MARHRWGSASGETRRPLEFWMLYSHSRRRCAAGQLASGKDPTVDINMALQAARAPSQLLNLAARHIPGQTPGERAGQAPRHPNHEVRSRCGLPAPDFARREDVRNGSRSWGATASGRTGVLVIRQGQRRPCREKHRHSLAERRLERTWRRGDRGTREPRRARR